MLEKGSKNDYKDENSGYSDSDGRSEGMIQHLIRIGEELKSISAEEQSDVKEELYDDISLVLEDDALDIQDLIDSLNEEVPEEVARKTREIDEMFINASNLFLEAVELYMEFIETEEEELLVEARTALDEGTALLQLTDVKIRDFIKDLPQRGVTA